MQKLTNLQNKVLKILASKLKNHKYAIRGTTSLVLQNIDMNVADIDIICDKKTALLANELFSVYMVEPVEFKESPKFKSYFGKFNFNGVLVEVMGEWQIKDKKGDWSKVFDGENYNEVTIDDSKIRVTHIDDELSMFLLMQRFTAFQKIKKQLG